MEEYLLEVRNLKTYFYNDGTETPAVDGVSFELKRGETLGIVGESGSGKSITSLSILQLVPKPHGKIVDGEIVFKGRNLIGLSEKEIRKIRGNEISMIFQEPMTSLNPVYTIGNQIAEVMILHQKLSKNQAKEKVIDILKTVGIPNAEKRIDQYPHQLSGGMRQRVMIAMALACNPDLLIADEPTTALDVTTQAQILELMNDLKKKTNTSILFITHDLGVIADSAEKVAVMYLGRVVEYTDVETFFEDPKHPYSKGLITSIPSLTNRVERLTPIQGQVPRPSDVTEGCRFAGRCKEARALCVAEEPPLLSIDDHKTRCWIYSDRWEDTKDEGVTGNGRTAAASRES
ncbi:ABC transporter ATP-binding protein [Cytobacillus spongiae]|jgi:peptide/nickel transport system ATP-binding protein/oligopeptide transport system ATP-binding protein|uniref:ABC transporter ATP-binding protein n=1 Tax=Cytobacillus spongiae TaxID=2901381 RepID=UPI001F2DA953|nr:ABC transporter ATP-binding protein [Cytobacillus spongiae]UII57543.1 ABC transporter ATP-binding protein [Cytobacillus spongiae]